MTSNRRPWPRVVRRYIYEMIALVVVLGLIAVGYLSWHRSASDQSLRLANDYHLASTSHYLKAMVELRHMIIHLYHDQVRENANNWSPETNLKLGHEYNRSVSYYLMQQEIERGLNLQYTFADSKFDALNARLRRQLTSFGKSAGDYFLKGADPNQTLPAINRLLTPIAQLVRLHTVVRDDLLIDMKERETRQAQLFLVLVSGLLLIGVLIAMRVLNAIDAVIARQQESEQEIREVNQRMALAADAAKFGIWDVDLIKNELVWDRWMFHMFGIDQKDFNGVYEGWARYAHPDDLERINEEVERTMRGGEGLDMEYRIIQPTGTVRHIKTTAIIMRGNDGIPVRMTGVNFDITRHKQAEEAIKAAGARYRTIVDTIGKIGEGLFSIDADYRVRYMNQVMLDWFGDQTGKICYQAVAGLEEPCSYCQLDKVIEQGKTVHYQSTMREGRDFEIVATPIENSDGTYSKMEVVRDVSERKQAKDQLEQRIQELTEARKASLNMMQDVETARQQAEQASCVKSEFLANMSHEIRTPLNAVTGIAYLLTQTRLSDKQAEYIDTIHRSMVHVTGLIDGLLDFSKAEAGKLQLESIPFDLDQVLDNLTNFVMQEAERKGVEVLFDLPLDLPRSLVGDPTRLGQILINLVGNAIKFCDRGEVLISAAVEQVRGVTAQLHFSVKDNGIGMDEAQISQLFEAFQQADSSATRRFGGTGLGLAICKYLVQAMNGKIVVESVLGEGSEFLFTVQLGLQEQQKEKLLDVPVDLRGLHFLVVDDNSTSRQVLGAILGALSFDYTAVASGQEAIAVLERSHSSEQERDYDIVLLDWMMPGMNGIDVATHITHDSKLPDPPMVIMVSAYEKAKVMQRASQAGVSGYLHKPVNASLLFDTIMQLLGRNLPKAHRRRATFTQAATNRINGGGRRVLIVEDQPVNRQIAEEILKRNGYVVESVENGQLAVDLLEQNPAAFDAVLMDLQMPVMDGYEATRRIRQMENGGELPIIAMTAHALEEEREKCRKVGMNAHVSKPVDVDLLLSELANWLGIVPSETDTMMEIQQPTTTTANALPDLVPGIDLADGMERLMGNHELYTKLLRGFPKQYGVMLDSIRKAIDTGSCTEAAKSVHALKGSAGNLSMMPLQSAAEKLQLALETGETTEDELKQLEQCFDEVVESIDGLNLRASEVGVKLDQSSGIATYDITEFDSDPLVKELATLLSSHDMRAGKLFEHIMESVRDDATIKALEPVGEQIAKLDYQEALRLLTQLSIN